MSRVLGQHCTGGDAVPSLSCDSQARPTGGVQFRSEREEWRRLAQIRLQGVALLAWPLVSSEDLQIRIVIPLPIV